jgi:hypothetical protein
MTLETYIGGQQCYDLPERHMHVAKRTANPGHLDPLQVAVAQAGGYSRHVYFEPQHVPLRLELCANTYRIQSAPKLHCRLCTCST